MRKMPTDLLSWQDFLASFQAVDAAKLTFKCVLSLDRCFQSVVAKERWGIPSTSAEAVWLLIQHGVS